eukprot:500274-Rhodomonas_salina.3
MDAGQTVSAFSTSGATVPSRETASEALALTHPPVDTRVRAEISESGQIRMHTRRGPRGSTTTAWSHHV